MSEGGPFGESKAVVGSSDAIGWWCRQCEISGTGFLRRSDELVMQKKIDSGCVCQDLVFTIYHQADKQNKTTGCVVRGIYKI